MLIQLDASPHNRIVVSRHGDYGFYVEARQLLPPAQDHETPFGVGAELELIVKVGDVELSLGLTDRQAAQIGRSIDALLQHGYPTEESVGMWPGGIWARELNG